MNLLNLTIIYYPSCWVSSLRGEVHGFQEPLQRCNSLKWNDHIAPLRLALHFGWVKQVFHRKGKLAKPYTSPRPTEVSRINH